MASIGSTFFRPVLVKIPGRIGNYIVPFEIEEGRRSPTIALTLRRRFLTHHFLIHFNRLLGSVFAKPLTFYLPLPRTSGDDGYLSSTITPLREHITKTPS